MRGNMSIRLAARSVGVPLWRIARELGISEPTLYRKLRDPLSRKESVKILGIIEKLKEGN